VVSIIVNPIMEKDHRSTAWIEGFAILMAVVVSSVVQAINNYQKEREFQKLNDEAEGKKLIDIIRDGKTTPMRLTECLVGDIVVIKGGDEISGDGIVVQANTVGCDESAMTGETDMLEKHTIEECIAKRDRTKKNDAGDAHHAAHKIHDVPSPVLVSGTSFKQGTGKMIITCIGMNSAIGRIKKTISDNKDDETPLQKKLEKIAEDIGKFGLVCAILTLLVIILRTVIIWATKKPRDSWGSKETGYIIQAFLIGITVLVVAIPEGLPLAVTLSLAYSVKKMLADNNLVRKLHACETMGGADIICSDKTGTLTLNKMYLTHIWNTTSYEVRPPNISKGPVVQEDKPKKDKKDKSKTMTEEEKQAEEELREDHSTEIEYTTFVKPGQEQIFELAMTCNSEDDPKKRSGNPTDMAILKYMLRRGKYSVDIRQKLHIEHTEPFTSDRKRVSTLIKNGSQTIYLLKGASEYVTASCKNILNLQTGQLIDIDAAMKAEISDAIKTMAKQSLRTIGIAFKYVDKIDKDNKDKFGVLEDEKSGFTLIGICGIKDLIRPEVPHAVAQCNEAGIQVKMVTGDNKITARAIAKECNIISPDEPDDDDNGRVMEGPDFYKLIGGIDSQPAAKKGEPPIEKIKNGLAFDKIYKNLAVLARSRPEDKYAMVTGLRERGHIVAVTGDGTNDAPALSKANVGFAMGITGTQVAKQAAAIMLMDDNFNSIVAAVKWGRNIYDSIRKFIQFQLTVNVCAVVITFISAAVTQESILSSVQMLWVNMIMDTLASLALATEAPTDEQLKRKPNKPDDYIISKKMAKHILGHAFFQIAIMMVFLFVGPQYLPDNITDRAPTLIKGKLHELVDERNGKYFVRTGLVAVVAEDKRWPYEENNNNPSRHYTYNFNVFVLMQVFNFVNARKINDEFNIFTNMFSTLFFPVIVICIIVLQVLITTFGSKAFRLAFWVGAADLGRGTRRLGHLHSLRRSRVAMGSLSQDHRRGQDKVSRSKLG